MKINILLPYKEKFDKQVPGSVAITVKNNLFHSKYLDEIKVFGSDTENPLFEKNFYGFKAPFKIFGSKNKYLAKKMVQIISKSSDKVQFIEIHNRPYLVDFIYSKLKNFPISLFLHTSPSKTKGLKTVRERLQVLNKCEAVFCISEFVRQQFIEGIIQNHTKVHLLYNGVEKKLIELPKKKKEVLFVGRLVPEKGVHLYVNAIKSIAHNFSDWNFGIIGSLKSKDKKIINYIEDTIKKFNNIGIQAKVYGQRNNAFVQDKMKTSSIIVIPSLCEEAFGLVAAEAMSNGVAVIATNIGGLPEVLKDSGILIENINETKLQNQLIKLMKNEKLLKHYQQKAWDSFEFSSKTSSEKLDHFRKKIFSSYY